MRRSHFFIKHSQSRKVIILLMYVDDMIVTGENEEEKIEHRRKLKKDCEIKELERLKYFFSIEVA